MLVGGQDGPNYPIHPKSRTRTNPPDSRGARHVRKYFPVGRSGGGGTRKGTVTAFCKTRPIAAALHRDRRLLVRKPGATQFKIWLTDAFARTRGIRGAPHVDHPPPSNDALDA